MNKYQSRKYLGIGNKKFVYLFFGKIIKYKGIENLIESFEKFDNDSLLLIAGQCDNICLKNYIINKSDVNKRIRFDCGFIPEYFVQT
jgi:glycosyltransferase involved in cell wall biosynthesis